LSCTHWRLTPTLRTCQACRVAVWTQLWLDDGSLEADGTARCGVRLVIFWRWAGVGRPHRSGSEERAGHHRPRILPSCPSVPTNPNTDACAFPCTPVQGTHAARAVPCIYVGAPAHGAPSATPAAHAPIVLAFDPSPALPRGAIAGCDAAPTCTAIRALALSAAAIAARARASPPHAPATACSAALLPPAAAAGAAPPPPAPCGCGRNGGSPRSDGPSSWPAPSAPLLED